MGKMQIGIYKRGDGRNVCVGGYLFYVRLC